MADFIIANNHTKVAEKGYVNNAKDRGKETYRGISRKWHPEWVGWLYVDYCKKFPGFPKNINDRVLDGAVLALYKLKFWDEIGGDLLPNQDLANIIYDAAVNMGVPQAIEFLQILLNLLNRNQRDYPDVKADGVMGQKTLSSTLTNVNKRGPYILIYYFHAMMAYKWITLGSKSPDQEEFMNGWGQRGVNNVKYLTDKYYGVKNHA